jgi:3-phenylpropionate/trans-cinnamate dioxygenase ferredoxin subunit
MASWIPLCPFDQLRKEGLFVLELPSTSIAVFWTGGEALAVENICTHDGGELAGGPVEGTRVTCPRHGACFDLKTGAVLAPPAYEPIRTYPVRIREGQVEIEI